MTDEIFNDVNLNEEWQTSFLQNILFLDQFLEMPAIVSKSDYAGSSAHREMKAVTMIGLQRLVSEKGMTLDRLTSKMEISRQEAIDLIKVLLTKRLIFTENNEAPFEFKLTQLGYEMYRFFINDIRERADQLATGLSDTEKEVFARVIEKLYRGVKEQSV